jgi:hypothetical protein
VPAPARRFICLTFPIAAKQVAWEQAHVREGKIPILPEIPEDQQDEDLSVIDGDNMSAEWWEEVLFIPPAVMMQLISNDSDLNF